MVGVTEISCYRGVIMGREVRDIREVDGLEDTQVSSEVVYSSLDGRHRVRIALNDNQWPHQSANFEPAAVRLHARHLLEMADDAELLNLEKHDDVRTPGSTGTPAACSAAPRSRSRRWWRPVPPRVPAGDGAAERARDVPRSCICRWRWRPQLARWVLWVPVEYCPWHHRF
jgi:hypothetical protein